MMLSARKLLDAGPTVSIGILTADLSKLSDELSILDEAGASIVHVDVMDGVFCPTLTVGPPVVAAIPDRFVKDCHLMIDEPLEKVQAFVAAGAGIITFQVESTRHPHRVLQALAGTGVLRGVALNPGTPVATLEPLVEELEMILVLAVNPGWGGQEFLPSTERRLADVRALIADSRGRGGCGRGHHEGEHRVRRDSRCRPRRERLGYLRRWAGARERPLHAQSCAWSDLGGAGMNRVARRRRRCQ